LVPILIVLPPAQVRFDDAVYRLAPADIPPEHRELGPVYNHNCHRVHHRGQTILLRHTDPQE